MRADFEEATTLPALFTASRRHFGRGPIQVPDEIFGLLRLAAARGTKRAGEIGAFDAGTSVLLSRGLPDLELLVVMDLFVKNRRRLRDAAPRGQEVRTIDGDSGHPRTVARLERTLGARRLDLLVIDGDHSLAGVRKDFLAYRSLVRPGGLIAFHDIVPVRSKGEGRWVGGVPTFWSQIKLLYETREFIAQEEPDGYGIGVVINDPEVEPSSLETTARRRPATGHRDAQRPRQAPSS